jgi:hypothetical protein
LVFLKLGCHSLPGFAARAYALPVDWDEPVRLAVGARGFTLADIGDQSLDGGILERVNVHRYSVAGDRVTRVPPIAVLPQDFVDEWIGVPWEEARRWSSASAMDRLRFWHARLRKGGKDREKLDYYSEFEFVQPCDKPPGKWKIGLSIDSQKRQDKLPPELFFSITEIDGAFYMTDVAQTRGAGCPGRSDPVYTLDQGLIEKELNQFADSEPR